MAGVFATRVVFCYRRTDATAIPNFLPVPNLLSVVFLVREGPLEFWKPKKVRLVWSVPMSSKKKRTGRGLTGGGMYLRLGGGGRLETFLVKDLWHVLPSPELSAPPPLAAL